MSRRRAGGEKSARKRHATVDHLQRLCHFSRLESYRDPSLFRICALSLALIPVMLGAIVFAHFANGFFYNNAGGGWEFAAFWALVLAVQALIGDGAHALKPFDLGRKPEPARA